MIEFNVYREYRRYYVNLGNNSPFSKLLKPNFWICRKFSSVYRDFKTICRKYYYIKEYKLKMLIFKQLKISTLKMIKTTQ